MDWMRFRKSLSLRGFFLQVLDGAEDDPVRLQVVVQEVGEVGQFLEAGGRQGIGGRLGVQVDHHAPGGEVGQGFRPPGLRGSAVVEDEFILEKVLEEVEIRPGPARGRIQTPGGPGWPRETMEAGRKKWMMLFL